MAIADPKNYAKREPDDVEPPKTADLLAAIVEIQRQTAQMIAEMRAGGSSAGSVDVIEQLLEQQQQLLVKTRPENAQAPGISVYSHPEGDLAHPKDPLRCPMTWVGYPLTTDTLTPQEVSMLNQLQPGEFRVTKADGTRIPFKVAAKYSDQFEAGTDRLKTERLDIWFPCKGDHRQNHGSMVSYLTQTLHGAIPSTEELLAEIARLKAEVQAAKTGLVGSVA